MSDAPDPSGMEARRSDHSGEPRHPADEAFGLVAIFNLVWFVASLSLVLFACVKLDEGAIYSFWMIVGFAQAVVALPLAVLVKQRTNFGRIAQLIVSPFLFASGFFLPAAIYIWYWFRLSKCGSVVGKPGKEKLAPEEKPAAS